MSDTAVENQEIKELFVLVGRNSDGVEGVASFVDPADGIMKPAIGGASKVDYLLVIGQALANASGLDLQLTKWTGRVDHELIHPEELPDISELGELL
jgi:hypothetical protein